MADYITAAQLCSYLSITTASHPNEIQFAITGASRTIDGDCGRSFDTTTATSDRIFTVTDWSCLYIDDVQSSTGFALTIDADGDGVYETSWATTDYELRPLNNRLQGLPWPYTSVHPRNTVTMPVGFYGRVKITARWGWVAVPDAIVQATLIEAARLFKRKDAVEGVVGGFTDFTAIRLARDDPDYARLIKPYRLLNAMV